MNYVDPHGLDGGASAVAAGLGTAAAEGGVAAGATAAAPVVAVVVVGGLTIYVAYEFLELLEWWEIADEAAELAAETQRRAAEHLAKKAAKRTIEYIDEAFDDPEWGDEPDMDDFPEDAKDRPRPPIPPGGDEDDGSEQEHQHHVFPTEFGWWFLNRYGLDVDDYTVILPKGMHDLLHCGRELPGIGPGGWWNTFVMERIRARERQKGSRLTRDEVLEVGQQMLDEYNLTCFPYPTPYRDRTRRRWRHNTPPGVWY